jgi:hypothetical protein
MTEYLLGDLKLKWNGSNPSVGGGALNPREGSLKEAVIMIMMPTFHAKLANILVQGQKLGESRE